MVISFILLHVFVIQPLNITGYLPNCAEAVQGMLAAASIGAIWSSTSPDFGVTVILLLIKFS